MKEVTGLARNIYHIRSQDGTYRPMVEVVVAVSEPVFRVDASGQLIRERTTASLRFAASPALLRDMAESFIRYADDAEGKADAGEAEES